MTIQDALRNMTAQLSTIYDKGEAASITDLVVESITGSKKSALVSQKEKLLTLPQEQQLVEYIERLLKHEPVQYVLNESWFCGLKFYVDQNVLIPRPETEELVEWIISNCKFPIDELKILDIGTGSGCIPISIKRRIRKADVWSIDISSAAINIAEQNSIQLGTEVKFINLDFLDKSQWTQLPHFDIIVSNPPYIPASQKETMQENVVRYEPATALFVQDNDPLIFYRAIAEFGHQHLNKGGMIYMEIHEDLGNETAELFREMGYEVELKKDMQGRERMINAFVSPGD